MFQIQAQQITLPLWGETIPNYVESNEEEVIEETNIIRYKNIVKPDLQVFLPSKQTRTGQAVIICPGGGYGILSYDWEGSDVAKWFNTKGIIAIVLKYRLPHSKSNIVSYKSPLLDAQRAIRVVRYNASKWDVDTNKVGIMGFSAGGHLAATLSTHYNTSFAEPTDEVDLMNARPDFSILIYPVITLKNEVTHKWSKNNLMGEHNNPEITEFFSNELHVDSNTPPTFIVHSADDKGVPIQNSILYYEALHKNKVPVEMHLYQYGGHGYGLATNKGYLGTWPERLNDWLNGF